MAPGWSMADELQIQIINQLIMQRRMWLSAEDQHLLSPIEMSWHKEKPELATKSQMAAFFGSAVKVVKE